MIPKRVLLLATLLAASLALVGCAGEQSAPAPTPVQAQPTPTATANTPTAVTSPTQEVAGNSVTYRVGLVTDGGKVDDGSLNQAVFQGLQRAAKEFNLVLNTIESAQPSDFAANIETFVDAGYDTIVTVGPLMAETTQAMAEAYPGVGFVTVDVAYETTLDNLVGLTFREDQMGFLAGALAGLISERKTVGVVAGVESLATRRLRSGYESGVRQVCPECVVLGITLDSFADPDRGKTAALSQIGEGADVIFGVGGAAGSGALLGATQQGAWAIGVDNDQYMTTFAGGLAEGADRLVSSAIKRADNAVYAAIRNVVIGDELPGGTMVFGIENQGVELTVFHEAESYLSSQVKMRLNEVFAMLSSGSLDTGVDPESGDLLQ